MKIVNVRDRCRSTGKLFHARGPATAKARSPMVELYNQCGARRVKETICRREREILAIGPKTSPWQGPYSISAGWGAEFEGTPLSDVLCFLTARHCF